MRHLDYPRCETLNRRCSVDAHFQGWAGSVLIPLLPIEEANTSFMNVCNQSPLSVPKLQYQKLLMLHWGLFPGWGREHVSQFFDYKGGQYMQKGERCTIVNISLLTVGYLNVTINRTSWNAEPEIGPNRYSKPRQHLQVDGYRSHFGPPRSSALCFWKGMEPKWPIFPVRTRNAGR